MRYYYEGIKIVLVNFPLLVLFVALPLFIFSYRKHGALLFWRALLLYSFLFYILCIYALVVYPLPDPDVVAAMQGPRTQLHLFQFVTDFKQSSVLVLGDRSTYYPALRQPYIYQPVFNIMMTVPFGMYMRYYMKQNFWQTILWTLLLSLSFEFIQLTAVFGMYTRPYRLFDVDDLFLNTMGGVIGFIFLTPFMRILPSEEQLRKWAESQNFTITYTRRAFAWIIDYTFLILIAFLVQFLLKYMELPQIIPYSYIAILLMYNILFVYWTDGHTLGKHIVGIKIVTPSFERISLQAVLIRNGLLHFIYPLIGTTGFAICFKLFNRGGRKSQLVGIIGCILLLSIPLLSLMYHAANKTKRLVYEVCSNTHVINDLPARTID